MYTTFRHPALLALFASLPLSATELQASLSMAQQSFANSDDITVQLTLSNPGTKPQKILRYLTPIDGVNQDLFQISAGDQQAVYTGRKYKRATPTAADYVTIAPGDSLTFAVELTSLYQFPTDGNYEVRYQVSSAQLEAPVAKAGPAASQSAVLTPIPQLSSEPQYMTLSGPVKTGETSELKWPAMVNLAGSASYAANCSASRQSSIASALTSAKGYASNSYNYLNSYPSTTRANATRYKTWFGSYTSTRWNTVTSNYNKINSALNNQPLQFDCGCTDSAYAYVYPNQPYKIYLCNAFWSASSTGTDSKAGTIVHETSHFTVVADTDDLAYGQSASKSLALSSPSQAIKNADSHEYFAENTPAQN